MPKALRLRLAREPVWATWVGNLAVRTIGACAGAPISSAMHPPMRPRRADVIQPGSPIVAGPCETAVAAVPCGKAHPVRSVRTFEELYAEIAQLPEGMTGEILEDGVVRVMSRPGRRHRRAAKACLDALSSVDADLRGTGWWIEVETEIRFPQGRLGVPDLAGWRVERVPELPDESPMTVLPDWCCEILSPRTARDDPGLRLVEVYQTLNGLPALVTTAQEAERRVLPPFEMEISLEGWWLPGPAPTE